MQRFVKSGLSMCTNPTTHTALPAAWCTACTRSNNALGWPHLAAASAAAALRIGHAQLLDISAGRLAAAGHVSAAVAKRGRAEDLLRAAAEQLGSAGEPVARIKALLQLAELRTAAPSGAHRQPSLIGASSSCKLVGRSGVAVYSVGSEAMQAREHMLQDAKRVLLVAEGEASELHAAASTMLSQLPCNCNSGGNAAMDRVIPDSGDSERTALCCATPSARMIALTQLALARIELELGEMKLRCGDAVRAASASVQIPAYPRMPGRDASAVEAFLRSGTGQFADRAVLPCGINGSSHGADRGTETVNGDEPWQAARRCATSAAAASTGVPALHATALALGAVAQAQGAAIAECVARHRSNAADTMLSSHGMPWLRSPGPDANDWLAWPEEGGAKACSAPYCTTTSSQDATMLSANSVVPQRQTAASCFLLADMQTTVAAAPEMIPNGTQQGGDTDMGRMHAQRRSTTVSSLRVALRESIAAQQLPIARDVALCLARCCGTWRPGEAAQALAAAQACATACTLRDMFLRVAAVGHPERIAWQQIEQLASLVPDAIASPYAQQVRRLWLKHTCVTAL